jgi:prepilin-type N-terminal cleavage/methylation domain-containing protein
MNKKMTDNHGFSLVELLIAASIMAITVVAVVSMVRKSREIQLSDTHRQEVRAILNAQFEKSYGFDRYASIPVRDSASTVIIDTREGNPLNGTLLVEIDSTVEYASGTPIPVKKVTLSVIWNETEDETDTITMSKWVAQ